MRNNTFRGIPEIVARSNRRRIWRKVVGVLSCIVVFCTTYALILPAITLEKAPVCGKEEHTHTEENCIPQPQEYRYEDDSLSVTVVLPAGSTVPKDASVRVAPIKQEEDRYSLLERQAQATVEGELNELVLYDVSFYTKDGAYLPVEDSAAVTITFKKAVLTGSQVEVLHYGEDAVPVALEGVEIRRSENQALSGVAFQTEGFSVFGVMTTRASTGVTLYPGQVYTVDEVYTSDVKIAGDAGAVKADTAAYTDILRLAAGSDDRLYTGTRVNVDNALYTFTAVEGNSNTYQISHGGLYLNFNDADADGIRLSSSTADAILFTDKTDQNSQYHHFLADGAFALSSGDRYLFFHGKAGDEYQYAFNLKGADYLEWCGGGFLLFRKAVGSEEESAVLPGFVQVTRKSDIVSGQEYLIVAKAQDRDSYYVLYPNPDAAERHQHAAKASPYKLTLTGNTAGTAAVTAGDSQWNVTVNDLVTVSPGKSVSIPLPEGAALTSGDPAIASVAIANGTATVTGLEAGETTATVTVNGQTYTWRIRVTAPVSFRLTYNGTVVTFHLRDANTHEYLPVDNLIDYVGAANTKYRFVPKGAEPAQTENQKNIVIPQIEGYQFSQATYHRSWGDTYHKITCFATTGYSGDGITVENLWNYLFYDEASPSTELNLGTDVSEVDIYLDYRKLPIDTTVSPSGTIINLFDYWVTGEDEGQVGGRPNEGINKDHAFRFTSNSDALPLNQWTGSIDVRQGIVANRLGDDGYPHLSGKEALTGTASEESLAYLFDPAYTGPGADFRKAYRNVGGLLQLDDQGYYHYDSTEHYAEYDGENNRFHIYPDWAVTYSTANGQFFPFDPYSTVSQKTTVANHDGGDLNHFFGMTMSTRFMQQFGGHTSTQGTVPMTFEFSGDDDVWIFIDGVLVADLGGIHDAASVKIDFAAGKVVINEGKDQAKTTYFREIFAGTNVKLTANNVTFTDNSYHTLKFYYMERGGVASNLHLKFNLVTFPASGITKVDQVGDPIIGAKFALYRTGADYVVAEGDTPICSGSTDADGEFVFTDREGHPLVLQDLYLGRDKNRPDSTETYPYYVLRETHVPQGYRGTGTDIHLKIVEGSGSGQENVSSYVMTCTNTRDSGAYASPSLQVTASNELTLADGKNTTISPGQSNGTLFGVVLKYIGPEGAGKDLTKEDNWSPVYGSASEGYTVVDRTQYPSIQDAIQAAKDHYIGNQNYFHPSSNGSLQALIEDLPGDIASYNFMAGNDQEVQYIVAYYWTDAETKITTRVQDYTMSGGAYSFSRSFGTDIHIPNMKNRIAVQKLDEDNVTPVNGAKFAMYRVDDKADAPAHNTEAYFYVPDGATEDNMTHIFLGPGTDSPFRGSARLCTDTGDTGTYSVNLETGIITVTINNSTYTITPTQVVTTAGSTHNHYKEDGIAEFEGMVSGKYIIRELTAPTGYEVNPHRAMVLVTDNAIYANAGDGGDGIAVSRGPGYLAGNLHYYASRGDIDNTLSWVYTQMKVSGVSDQFSDVTPENYGSWKWIQARRVDTKKPGAASPTDNRGNALTAYLEFIESGSGSSAAETSARFSYAVDTDRPHTASENVALDRRLYTQIGWSYLEILQDYVYGNDAKSPNANYENWQYLPGTATPDDLSNLFSRSIYVHVTDPKLPGDLEITKTVVPKEQGKPLPEEVMNTGFTFTVHLTNPTKPVDGTYKYTVYDNSDPAANPRPVIEEGNPGLVFENGTATVSLKHNQAVVIHDLPAGSTYDITETFVPKFTTTAIEKVLITDSQGTRPGTKAHNGSVVSGSMYWYVEHDVLDNLSKVDFTNTYDEALDTVTITVQKVNAEHQNVGLPGAEFTLTKAADGKTWYSTGTAWTEAKTTLSTNRSGMIQFSLIDAGTYTLTEVKAPNGYYPLEKPITIVVENVETGGTASKRIASATFGTVGENSLTLIVPNRSGYELPEAGGMGTAPIYLLGGILVMGAGLSLVTKKRMGAKK